MAQALSTANPSAYSPFAFSLASSTAKTTFAGVTATAAATATYSYAYANPTYPAKTEAVAEGGSAQTSVDPDVYTAMSVASPDKAFATTLIGGESHVADAFLGPQDEIFGAAILVAGTSTFDFDYQGDLRLGVIDGGGDVTVNGAEVSIGDPGDDTVINLGFFGPNIDLTISGFGTFVIGRTVPEASTWAMMLLGFAGLGFVGYRQTRAARPQAT
jgi:hypothetical protein